MNYNIKLVGIFNIFSVQSIIFQYKSNTYNFEHLKEKINSLLKKWAIWLFRFYDL